MKAENRRQVINSMVSDMDTAMREELMSMGLGYLLKFMLGDYLEEPQIQKMADMMKRLRNRKTETPVGSRSFSLISSRSGFCNRQVPQKRMGKEELATLLYNVAPYALISRKETAMMAKTAFPNFFSSVATINVVFNRRRKMPRPIMFSDMMEVPDFSEHTPEAVEYIMIQTALDVLKRKKL